MIRIHLKNENGASEVTANAESILPKFARFYIRILEYSRLRSNPKENMGVLISLPGFLVWMGDRVSKYS